MLFQIRRGCLPGPKYFLLEFNGTPHPLGLLVSCSGTGCVLQRVFQTFSPCATTAMVLLPCACMHSKGYAFSYIRLCICVYVCQQKNRLFSALPLENLLLSVICCLVFKFKHLQCGLLRPASCTDRVIHAFPNKTSSPPGPEIFSYELFNGTPHSLG